GQTRARRAGRVPWLPQRLQRALAVSRAARGDTVDHLQARDDDDARAARDLRTLQASLEADPAAEGGLRAVGGAVLEALRHARGRNCRLRETASAGAKSGAAVEVLEVAGGVAAHAGEQARNARGADATQVVEIRLLREHLALTQGIRQNTDPGDQQNTSQNL